MTPAPTPAQLRARSIFDPIPGSFHFQDLINQVKDGFYVKDRTSAYIAGLFMFAKEIGLINVWEGQLLQIPFIKGMVLRVGHPNFGHPFLGPDGKVFVLGGRILNGSIRPILAGCFQISPLTVAEVQAHPDYNNWIRFHYEFSGGGETYVRVSNRNSIKECDEYINGQQYTPGPLSVPLAHYTYRDHV